MEQVVNPPGYQVNLLESGHFSWASRLTPAWVNLIKRFYPSVHYRYIQLTIVPEF